MKVTVSISLMVWLMFSWLTLISPSLAKNVITEDVWQEGKPSQTATQKAQISQNPAVDADTLTLNQAVIDQAGILNAQEISDLTEQLLKIYQDNLAQIGLVLVPTTNGVPIFDYTHAVAKRWGLGQEKIDDGVLILVAVNDRQVFIATGYGVEGVLPDVALKRIIREDITPAFKNGQYAQGLSAGIARIEERLRADPEVLAKADQSLENHLQGIDVVALLIMAMVIGSMISNFLGRLLGASIATLGFVIVAKGTGFGMWAIFVIGLLLWLFLLIQDRLPIRHTHGFRSTDHFGHGDRGGHHGGFGGGGGRFGGGGAGGSW